MFSEVFWTGFYSSMIAVGAQCYKSKCSQVKICCITINRDVAGEEQLDQRLAQNPIQSNSNL